MIASWMAYAALLSAVVTLAAIGAEHVAAARRWPARSVWVLALAISVAWPLGEPIVRAVLRARAAAAVMPFAITVLPAQVITGDSGPTRAELINRSLLALWIIASVVLFLRLTVAVRGLRRMRRDWRSADVDGIAVRLAPNEGPAVVGLRSMEIVLPEWIVALDTHLRAMVLRHEDEHRRARDPYVLFAAAVLVALMPWNLALWFQAKRLRLAIELDCDARVLRVHPSAERYGLLMMTIAQRRSVAPTLFAPMLTEPATQLERRIAAMITTGRVVRATVYGGLAASVALLFACTLRSDSMTGPGGAGTSRATTPRGTPQLVTANQTYFEFQVEQQALPVPGSPSPKYPDLLRRAGVDGTVLAQFVIDTLGRADLSTFKVLKSTHELFTESVRAALPQIKFHAAQVGGRPVKQLVQMPFDFSISSGQATNGRLNPVFIQGARAQLLPNAPVAKVPAVQVSVPQNGVPPTTLPSGTYFEYQVTKAVSPHPGNPSPRYPDALRTANVEGQVLAQFIVDENGMADTSSFTIIRSTHDLFSVTVRNAVPQMRFYPAELNGRPVRQLVQMPFQFSLTKD
jgi:TonB family protein